VKTASEVDSPGHSYNAHVSTASSLARVQSCEAHLHEMLFERTIDSKTACQHETSETKQARCIVYVLLLLTYCCCVLKHTCADDRVLAGRLLAGLSSSQELKKESEKSKRSVDVK